MATSTSRIIGAIGQALKLDGVNDYVKVTQGGGFNVFGLPYSISAWVKEDTPALSLPASHRIVSWSDGTNNIQLGLATDDVYSGRRFYITESSIDNDPADQATAGDASLGWHHIVVTSDGAGGNYNMYLDGVLSNGGGAGVYTSSNNTNSTFLYLGQRGTASGYMKGGLDEVRIYGRTLSASDVKKLYNMGKSKFQVSNVPGNLKRGLVGHWTFDAKNMVNNVADVSGNGNTGYLQFGASGNTSTSSMRVIGKIGQGLKFDGVDDAVVIPDSNTFTFSDGSNDKPFSLSLWVNYQGWNTSDSNPFVALINKANSYIPFYFEWDFAIGTNGKVGFQLDDTSTSNKIRVDSVETVPKNKWTHLIATYNGSGLTSGMKIYINGVLATLTPTTGGTYVTMRNNISPVTIGQELYSGTVTYRGRTVGKMDDIRVYSRALSASEIKQLYNLGR
jgi:hypothetical protein